MEIDAANLTQHKIFPGNPGLVDKKMYEKSRFGALSTDEMQELIDKAVPDTTKKPQSSGWDYLTVRTRFSIKKLQTFNMTVEILRIRKGYVTTATIFTLMLQNGLLALVVPHFRHQYMKYQKKSWMLD